MSDQVAFCAECGTKRQAGTAFCMECGTPFPGGPAAPVPAPPSTTTSPTPVTSAPPTSPAYAVTPQPLPPAQDVQQTHPVGSGQAASSSRRGRPVGIALIVLLLLGGVAAAGWWLLDRDGDNTTAGSTVAGGDGVDPDAVDPSEEAPDEEGSPSGEPSPSVESPETKTCWDGVTVERLADCRPLEGVDGLRHVFPSMDANFDRCRENVPSEGKIRAWACRTKLADGEKVSIVYSEWQSQALMTEHYFAKFTSPPVQEGAMYLWGVSQRPMSYQASGMFVSDYPYSFSVVAPTFAQAEEGLGHVEVRPAQELPKR